VATSLAAARDTQRLAPIADSIESLARHSGYGRDHKLPHHVRGLLWLSRREPRKAAEEFRRALFSPTHGYTRTNLELGRLLLSFGEAREAIGILRPALRGNTEAMNFYVTRMELHELLARAFEAAALPDSAAAHYRTVIQAWQNGDPAFQERARMARTRLERLRQAGSFR
jgi:lipopolysaccharide biosynthesis regulator YciM